MRNKRFTEMLKRASEAAAEENKNSINRQLGSYAVREVVEENVLVEKQNRR